MPPSLRSLQRFRAACESGWDRWTRLGLLRRPSFWPPGSASRPSMSLFSDARLPRHAARVLGPRPPVFLPCQARAFDRSECRSASPARDSRELRCCVRTRRRRCCVRTLHAPASLSCALAARAGVAVVCAGCTRRRRRCVGTLHAPAPEEEWGEGRVWSGRDRERARACGPAISIQTEAPGPLVAPVVRVTRWQSARSCDLPRPQACPGSGVTVRVMTRSSRPGAMWHGLDTGTARQASGNGPTLVTQARILIPQCS